MRVEVKRDRKTSFPIDIGKWVTFVSVVSKAEKVFWLSPGVWWAVEIYDRDSKEWKVIAQKMKVD